MKGHALLLLAAATITFIGSAKANVPDPSVDLNTCLTWAHTYEGTASFMPSSSRCHGLHDCNANYSDNAENWRDCKDDVEARFRAAMEVTEGVGNRQALIPAGNMTSPAVTEASDSYYEEIGPEHKGFIRSTQGPN